MLWSRKRPLKRLLKRPLKRPIGKFSEAGEPSPASRTDCALIAELRRRRHGGAELHRLIGNKANLIGEKAKLIGNKAKLIGNKSKLMGSKAKLIGTKQNLQGARRNHGKLLGNKTNGNPGIQEPIGTEIDREQSKFDRGQEEIMLN